MLNSVQIELKRKPKSELSAMLQMLSLMMQLGELIESLNESKEKEHAKSVFSMLDSALAQIEFDD